MARWKKRFEHCFTHCLSNLFSRHLESTHLEKAHGNIDHHLVPVSLVWSLALLLLSNFFCLFCDCLFYLFVFFLYFCLLFISFAFNLLFGPTISIEGRTYRAPGRVVRSTNKKTKGHLFPTFFRRSKGAKLGQRGELQKNYVQALTVRCKSVPLAFMIS